MTVNFLSTFLKNDIVRYKKKKFQYDLIIYDDAYPHPSSGFRLAEFNFLLSGISNSKAILTGSSYGDFSLPAELHRKHISDLEQSDLLLKGKLEPVKGEVNINCRLFYCIFLNNIYANLEWIEKFAIPFVFTLYPGGGFTIGVAETETRLKRIFSSKYFRKVIVTQRKTYDYVLNSGFCTKDDILFVFGVVVPRFASLNSTMTKKYFHTDKQFFDICFCAAKYTQYGEDKGYPLFVEFMKIVSKKYNFIRFHIIGGFDRYVINVDELGDKVNFYGYQDYNNLKSIFQSIDLIISPNQPNKFSKGSFDGFPLGTVIEAALNGVVVMLTDPFNENVYFDDGKDLVIIKPDVQDMVRKFESLIDDMAVFYEIAENGKKRFQHLYSTDYQLKPRIELLQSVLAIDHASK
jgi:glycosyltransferase involved in cell wall biosynthesis